MLLTLFKVLSLKVLKYGKQRQLNKRKRSWSSKSCSNQQNHHGHTSYAEYDQALPRLQRQGTG
jgi:hypothetical protein